MSAALSLSMGLDPADLERVSGAVVEFAQAQGWSSDIEFKISLVIEELVRNVVNHGKPGGEGRVEIEIASGEDAITVDIMDNSHPFDPLTEAPEADTKSSVRDRPVGGLGIHLVKEMMDEVSYRREGEMNHITLVKRKSG